MKRTLLALACALILLGSQQSASAGLVTNGGFETGDFSGWTLDADPGLNFVDTGFAHSGDFAAWFGEVGGLGTLSQSLSTYAGVTYSLTFWFAGDGDDPSAFQALIGTDVLLDLVNPPFDFDYVEYNYIFKATGDSTLLSFKFMDEPFFINLDDVSVDIRSTPEPATVRLACMGAALAFARVIRRNRSRKSA